MSKIPIEKNIYFYHIRYGTKAHLLTTLIGKSLKQQKRLIIRTPDLHITQNLSDILWEHEGFFPHATPDDAQIDKHPIYITACTQNPIKAEFLFLYGQALRDYEGYERVFMIFHDENFEEKEFARDFWKKLQENPSYQRCYWTQNESQKWEEKKF